MKQAKIIFLKPIEIKKSINFAEIIDASKKSFNSFKRVLFETPTNPVITWTVMIILSFGFWDTFVSTFQVEFLNKIIYLNQSSEILMQT